MNAQTKNRALVASAVVPVLTWNACAVTCEWVRLREVVLVWWPPDLTTQCLPVPSREGVTRQASWTELCWVHVIKAACAHEAGFAEFDVGTVLGCA